MGVVLVGAEAVRVRDPSATAYQQAALRCPIVLAAVARRTNREIGVESRVDVKIAVLWCGRFAQTDPGGSWAIASGRERKPTCSPNKDQRDCPGDTLEPAQRDDPVSCRPMARAQGMRKYTVSTIWRSQTLKPHWVKSFGVLGKYAGRRIREFAGIGAHTISHEPHPGLRDIAVTCGKYVMELARLSEALLRKYERPIAERQFDLKCVADFATDLSIGLCVLSCAERLWREYGVCLG